MYLFVSAYLFTRVYKYIYMYIYIYTCIYRLVPASGTTWGGGGGVGWDVNVHVTLRQDVNVHVNLRQQWMLRTCGVGGWGGMLTFM